MAYFARIMEPLLSRAARAFPAVVLTGPRRAGKTTMLRRTFPKADYRLLEDPAVLAAVRSDPAGFLDDLALPVIIDEIQNAPELLAFVRARIDASPHQRGRWLITGSQDFALMRGVSESMAGRAAILQLPTMSTLESPRVNIVRGGFPEVLARPKDAQLWFQSYLQTYLERDVRQISGVRDLATFRRFLSIAASRTGQILNRTDLAAPLAMSVPGINAWVNILETTGLIVLVPPYFENFGKRLIKSPKLYWMDSGLACHLLGIESERAFMSSPFLGPLYEGFIASEIVKQQQGSGKRRELYYFRDQRGFEVDFVVPRGSELMLIEAKASRTIFPAAAKPIATLATSLTRRKALGIVVHMGDAQARSILPGVKSMTLAEMLAALQ